MSSPIRPLLLAMLLPLSGVGCGEDGSASPDGGSGAPCEQALCLGPDGGGDGPEASDELVDAAWLAEHRDDTGLQVLDVRSAAAFAEAAIEGAIHLDAAALRATVDGVPGQVTDPATTGAQLAMAGLAPGSTVIVYDEGGALAGPRVVWTLRYHMQMDARLLDGGSQAWQQVGQPLSPGMAAGAGDYPTPSTVDGLRVDQAWVRSHLDDPMVVFVDARTEGEYDAGHIPSALSFNWPRNLEGGLLKSPEALAEMYGDIAPDTTVVAYCQTGSRASMAWLGLVHAGFEDVRLYDGSMAEWGSNPDNPIEP